MPVLLEALLRQVPGVARLHNAAAHRRQDERDNLEGVEMSQPFNTSPARPFTPIQSIELGKAQLCLDCNMITEINNSHCQVCQSHSVLPLAKVLEGKR